MRYPWPALLFVVILQSAADPLFDTDDPLEITLRAPFSDLVREEDKSVEYPGTLVHRDTTFAVELSVRGNKRLHECRYPPLRVDFDNDQLDDTLFDHQKDIKLVVLCKPRSKYEDYLRTEFLVYRMLNLITPVGYRVRWTTITYEDTAGRMDPRTEQAFFVERKTRVAKRLDLDKTDVESVAVDALAPEQAALVGLFQYIIANPDYSIIAAPPGDECCHNAKLLARRDGKYVPIIYDFDSSGIIDAEYAVPNPSLNIRRVTQRVYRGYCAHNDQVRQARSRLLAVEDRLMALVENDPLLGPRGKRVAMRFLERSMDILRDDRRFEREIIRECR